MKYRIRKPITIDSVLKAGRSCEEFKKNLNLFLNMERYGEKIDLFKEIDIGDIVPCFRHYPAWESWLIEKGFIEVTGMTFHVGQYFTHESFNKCIMSISLITSGIVNVIAHNIEGTYIDSNRLFTDGLRVEDRRAITMAEMCKMTGFNKQELFKIRLCNIEATPIRGEK